MKYKDSWERLEKNIGQGVKIIKFKKKTPFEKIMEIGKARECKEYLESQKVGIPKYTKAQRKKIMRDMKRYFNYQTNRNE